jgi:flagellar biosynthetic protein FlhB
MAFGARDDHTESATPKRRQEARERGQVAKSRELAGALSLLAVVAGLWFLGPTIWEGLTQELKQYLQGVTGAELQIADIHTLISGSLMRQFALIAPVLGAALVVSVLTHVLQVGLLFTTDPLLPRFSRLNPASGLSRLFSLQAVMELLKAVLKLAIVGAVAFSSVQASWPTLFLLGEQGVGGFFAGLSGIAAGLLGRSGLALLVLGGLDYAFQRWHHEQSLKMTKQEVRDEARQQEGDPKIKARIRSMQRDLSRRQMMAAVPQATVVITNPTHLAVALAYDRGKMAAPQVVARGAGHLAERIKTLAREAGVPIMEDKPLARALYRHVEVGEYIPATLYKAVAQVLAYVYSLQGKRLNPTA